MPRQTEIPERKISEIAATARQVSRLSFVRPGGVGHMAACASAQYALAAIADGAPMVSFASAAGWFHDAATVAPLHGEVDGVAKRLDRARAALAEYPRGGDSPVVPTYDSGNDRAAMFIPLDYYANPGCGAVRRGRTR